MSDEFSAVFIKQKIIHYQNLLNKLNQEIFFYLLTEPQNNNDEVQRKIELHFVDTQCLQYLIDGLRADLKTSGEV